MNELDDLLRRCNYYVEVASEQMLNKILYGTPDPTGGAGRQLYPISHSMFPWFDPKSWVDRSDGDEYRHGYCRFPDAHGCTYEPRTREEWFA